MASTYSTNLAIELIGTGDQAGAWGNTTNTNLGTLIEQAISGYVTQAVSTGTDTTITIPNGATGVARNMYIELTGTGGASTNLIVPANKKLYFIFNNTSSGQVTVKVSGQTGVSVPNKAKVILVSNGTDIIDATNYIGSAVIGNITATSGTITTLASTSAIITTLTSTSAGITTLSSGSANITQLNSTSGTISTLASTSAAITTLSGTTLTYSSASITNLTATSLVLSNLSIASANITTLTSSSATISTTLALSGGTANGVLYLNGSKVATSGTALVFDGSKLGINRTPSTGYALDVDTSNASYQRIIGSDQANVRLRFENGGPSGRIWELVGGLPGANNTNFSIRDVTGSTTPLTIDSSGNLGIGTGSPAGPLNVAAADTSNTIGSGTAAINITNTNESAFDRTANLIFSTGTGALPTNRIAAISAVYTSFNTSRAGALAFATDNGSSSFAERMRITSAGNVGIGTSSPASALYVKRTSGNAGIYADYNGTNIGRLEAASNGNLYIGLTTGSGDIAIGNTANATALNLSASGNLGLGVTPDTVTVTHLQLPSSAVVAAKGDVGINFASNAYFNSGWKYATSTFSSATNYLQESGRHIWYSAGAPASRTAGNTITFTQAMTLDADGDLGVGTTSPAVKLDVNSSGTPPSASAGTVARFVAAGSSGFDALIGIVGGNAGRSLIDFSDTDSASVGRLEYSHVSNFMAFHTNAAERARITSGGDFALNGGNILTQGTAQTLSIFASASAINGTARLELYGTTTATPAQAVLRGSPIIFTDKDATERARITSGGQFQINTTSGGFNGTLLARSATSTSEVFTCWNDTTTGDGVFIKFFTDGGIGRGQIDYNRGAGLVAYNTTSDYRAKDVYGLLENTGSSIDALKVYNGKMKGATQERPMLIAHEAQKITPYAVTGEKDAVNEDGTPKYQQMDHSSLVPLLIAEIQSLRARVAQLESK